MPVIFCKSKDIELLNGITVPNLVNLILLQLTGEFLIFCEVKTRRGSSGPHPSLSVTAKKIGKLRQLGELYLSLKHLTYLQPRFDVIAVQLGG